MVEENKKMLTVENEMVKKPPAPGVPMQTPIHVLSRPDDAKLPWSDENSCVHRVMVVGLTLFSAVAFVLLHLGPFATRLLAIVSCSVMERGAVSG